MESGSERSHKETAAVAGTASSGGRNKKSAGTHVLRGTFRGDRHGDPVTVEAPKGRPESPKPLEGDALEEWDRMVVCLERAGTLSTNDGAALYQYCKLFADTERLAGQAEAAEASVMILEQNIRGLEGAQLVAVFQEISKMRRLEATYSAQIRQGRMGLRTWLVELGQTPAARTRVKAAASAPKSKVDSFREKKGA